MKRVVLDCNVLVSALIRGDSAPGLAFDKAREHCRLVTSDACLLEVQRTFSKPKLERYFSREESDLFLEVFRLSAMVVVPERHIQICRDPKDDKYLEVAVAAQADCIISGDPDLLTLHPFEGIPILNPREFLNFPV